MLQLSDLDQLFTILNINKPSNRIKILTHINEIITTKQQQQQELKRELKKNFNQYFEEQQQHELNLNHLPSTKFDPQLDKFN